MKLSEFLSILIIITNIYQSNQNYLYLTNYTTEHYPIVTGSWKDLIGTLVECPDGGKLKNFVLRKNSSEFWYEYQCYYSKEFKDPRHSNIMVYCPSFITYKESYAIKENIEFLNDFSAYCPLDFGLISFNLTNDSKGNLIEKLLCCPLKPKYSTKVEIQTKEGTANATSLDGLVDIVVGSQETEDDENIAYPLRGFIYKVNTTSSKEKPTVSYLYGYSILRNMKKEYESAKQTFENLRNNNTQID